MSWQFGEHNGIGWRTTGSGTPIVILRGLGRWSEHWCGFDDLLARHFQVIAIDNRGFGMSKKAAVGIDLSIDQLADDVAGVLKQLSLESVIIVGVSLGGMLAISLAGRYPDLVRKLVLVNSSVGGSPYRRITNKALAAISRGFVSKEYFYGALAQALLAPNSSPQVVTTLQTKWSEIDERHGLMPRRVLIQLMAAAKFKPGPRMQSVRAPTLVLKGSQDQFIDPRNSDWICQHIQGSKLHECNGGHELGLDKPEWLAEEIGRFAQVSL